MPVLSVVEGNHRTLPVLSEAEGNPSPHLDKPGAPGSDHFCDESRVSPLG